ncbi:MAG: chorismate mutase, partial [Clostridia bacterium]|nr:chorismate mutase [Clostridia bacterium]
MGKRMRELAQIRQELDEIDREMVKLFERRMTLC